MSIEVTTLVDMLSLNSVNHKHTNNSSTSDHNADMELWEQVIVGILLFLLCSITSAGNYLVLHAIRSERKLQTVSNLFILSLAVSDFIVGTLVMPISVIYTLTNKWYFGLVVCQIWLILDYTASTASILNMFILSLDRYWSVTQPIKYIRRRTKKRARVMITGVWLLSSLWIVPISGWHWFANEGVRTIEKYTCETEYATNVPLKVATGLFNFFIPIGIMYGLYGKIFYEVRKRSRSTAFRALSKNSTIDDEELRNSTRRRKFTRSFFCRGQETLELDSFEESSQGLKESNKAPKESRDEQPMSVKRNANGGQENSNLLIPDSATTTANKCNDACSESPDGSVAYFCQLSRSPNRAKQSNKGTNSLRRITRTRCPSSNSVNQEIKAARQLGVIMGAFTVCFLPYFILFLVVPFCEDCVSNTLMTTFTWIGYFNSTLNPFLYPLCNNAFRTKFRQMLTCQKSELSRNRSTFNASFYRSTKVNENI